MLPTTGVKLVSLVGRTDTFFHSHMQIAWKFEILSFSTLFSSTFCYLFKSLCERDFFNLSTQPDRIQWNPAIAHPLKSELKILVIHTLAKSKTLTYKIVSTSPLKCVIAGFNCTFFLLSNTQRNRTKSKPWIEYMDRLQNRRTIDIVTVALYSWCALKSCHELWI